MVNFFNNYENIIINKKTSVAFHSHWHFKLNISLLSIKMGKRFSPSPPVRENCYFLRNYLNISYFMCFSPFYYKFENGQFIHSTWKSFKFYCVISNLLTFLCILGELQNLIYGETVQKTPVDYLKVMRFSEYTFQKCVLLIKFWSCKDTFVKTLNFLQSKKQAKISSSAKLKLATKLLAHFIIVLYIILGIIYLCDGIVLLTKPRTSSTIIQTIWENLIILGKRNYFIDRIFLNATSNLLDNVVGVASIIGFGQR